MVTAASAPSTAPRAIHGRRSVRRARGFERVVVSASRRARRESVGSGAGAGSTGAKRARNGAISPPCYSVPLHCSYFMFIGTQKARLKTLHQELSQIHNGSWDRVQAPWSLHETPSAKNLRAF